MMKRLRWSVPALACLWAAGCGDNTTDGSTIIDMAVVNDVGPMTQDFTTTTPDILVMDDMLPPTMDLTPAGTDDMPPPQIDLMPPPPPVDMTMMGKLDGPPSDLVSLPDLVKLPDLVPPSGDMSAIQSLTVIANLTGHQEVPATASLGKGTATVTVNMAKTTIDVKLSWSGLANNVQMSHIHFGLPGVNGPILFTIGEAAMGANLASPLAKTFTAADFKAVPGVATFNDAVTAILTGGTYVNLHTKTNPNGEIRGHLGPATLPVILSGGQEVPPTKSAARATGVVKLNAMQDTIDVTLNVGTLMPTEAHIYYGASGRGDGPKIFDLPAMTGTSHASLGPNDFKKPMPAVISLFVEAVDSLLSGRAYLNVLTAAIPVGEVRGEVGPVQLSSTVSGQQEAPPIKSTARATAFTVIDGGHTQISTNVAFTGLMNGTVAHFHVGAVGVSGPVILPLVTMGGVPNPLVKTVTAADLTKSMPNGINSFDDAIDAMLSGRVYFNVHTTTNASGEARGQVGPVTLTANLNGKNQVPVNASKATATETVSIDGMQGLTSTTLVQTNLQNPTGVQIHVGAPMMNGNQIFVLDMNGQVMNPLLNDLVAKDLKPSVPDNIKAYEDAINAMLSGLTYVNINTKAFTMGEIRGQLLP